MAPLRVALLNDYEIVVEGLRAVLEPYAERVVVVAASAGKLPPEPFDVVLYDAFGAPRTSSALDYVPTLRRHPGARLVIYTWLVEAALADPVLADVAHGYLSKAADAETLVRTLEQVHAGRTPDTTDITGAGPGPDLGRWPGQAQGLTARESEVIALITQGFDNHQVAARMYLSINTVKSYIRSAYLTIGVDSRSRAVLWALHHGFGTHRTGSGADESPDEAADAS